MGNVSVNELLQVLRDAGVGLQVRPGSAQAIEGAAAKRGIQLDPQDQAALGRLEEAPRRAARIKPDFNVIIDTHPQMAIPYRRPRPMGSHTSAEQKPLPKSGLPPWGQV